MTGAVSAVPYRKNLKWPTLGSAYYVAPNGSDSNSGTVGSPFKTFGKAQTAMESGNKITYVRSGRTYLAASITSGATSLTVTAVGNMPASGTYYVVIDDETLHITAGAGTTSWTVARGQLNTTGASHAAYAAVDFVYQFAAALALTNAGDANTTYSNYPGEKPVVDMGGATAFQGISLEEDGVWINGIRFQNTRSTLGEGAWSGHNTNASAVQIFFASNGKVSNVECYNMNPGADDTHCAPIVGIDGYVGFEVANCKVYNCGSAGISFFEDSIAHQAWVSDCIVHDVCLNTGGDNGAIYFWDDTSGFGSMISMAIRNIVYNHGATPQDSGYAQQETYAFYADNEISNTMWFGNWTYGNGSHSAHIHGGTGTLIYNNIHDMTNLFCSQFYQDQGITMSGNVLSTNIYYSSAPGQPVDFTDNHPAVWLFLFSGTTAYPSVNNSLYYSPNVTMVTTGWDAGASSNVTLDSSPNVTNPQFRNAAGNDYALLTASPALALTTPFLYIQPGAGPSLAGLPPTWAAMPHNLIRNSDPTVGSALATSTGGGIATGGTLPTNWTNAGSSLNANVYYIGRDANGVPTIRLRYFGTTTSTQLQLNFDETTTNPPVGSLVTFYAKISICGGSLKNTTGFFIVQTANPSDTTLNPTNGQFAPTGVPTWISMPTTVVTPVGTTSIYSNLIIGVNNSAAVDFTIEISAPQLVY